MSEDVYQIKPGTKLERWLKFYLDRNNLETYMNATKSTMAAGYDCSSYLSFKAVGAANLAKLSPLLKKWVADEFSEDVVKGLLVQSMRATKTIFVSKGEHVEEREVVDHNARVPALRLAAKIKGMEAPNKHEHSGLGGKALEVTVKPGMTSKQAIEECEKMLREI